MHGVVLEAFGAGNVPLLDGREVFPLAAFVKRGDPGRDRGRAPSTASVDLALYEGGRRAAREGAISAGDMTAEAAVVKLMAALGRAKKPADVRKAFAAGLGGGAELTR